MNVAEGCDNYSATVSGTKVTSPQSAPGVVQENGDFDFLDEDLLSGAGIVEPECLDKTSMISGAVIFLAAQLVIVILFAMIWRRNLRNSSKGLDLLEGSTAGTSRADSLSYLYESGFARRLQ